MELSGKVALITGAGRGLGRATAAALSREGAAVALLSRTLSELDETAELISKEGGKALVLQADISDEIAVREAVNRTSQELGPISILVNNAGVVGPAGPLHEVDPDDWNYTIAVNLGGARQLTQEVVPLMLRAGGGKIVNVTSGLADFVMPLFGSYSISKAGLNHMTRIMARELAASDIQVNGLDPGVMDTRMQEEIREMGPEILGKALHDQFVSFKTTGSLKPPEDVAKLSVFLCSNQSVGVTGEIGGEAEYRDYGFGLSGE
jgi:NAD(P)-dependent dehydrogenase (short-subunit alcohol dehydrogenase family)